MKKITPEKILSLLPQTQCQKCGYSSCHDYANAIAKGAPINCCPTGGEKGIRQLSRLTKKPFVPIDPQHSEEKPYHVVLIDESLCVGCELCIKACPVDAIIGAYGLAHSILVQQCTGCDLCIKACPVDCILIQNNKNQVNKKVFSDSFVSRAKTNYEKRQKRLKEKEKKQSQAISKKENVIKRKNLVAAAIEKARKQIQKNV